MDFDRHTIAWTYFEKLARALGPERIAAWRHNWHLLQPRIALLLHEDADLIKTAATHTNGKLKPPRPFDPLHKDFLALESLEAARLVLIWRTLRHYEAMTQAFFDQSWPTEKVFGSLVSAMSSELERKDYWPFRQHMPEAREFGGSWNENYPELPAGLLSYLRG